MESEEWFIPETFSDFQTLAKKENLSKFEKIGFPDSYRSGIEKSIYEDICSKLTNLRKKEISVLDIGPGLSDLPRYILDDVQKSGSVITLIDSAEMLFELPDGPHIHKIPGRFPEALNINLHSNKMDVILMYSVIQYIVAESSLFEALDSAFSLLKPGGQFLIGDIPNVSMRNRFFMSDNGTAFHKKFMNTDQSPAISPFDYPAKSIDDSVVFSILMRARLKGFQSFVLPQQSDLPFANRREDILIVSP